ncbi:MAG: hypothetical protein QOD86_379 [Miltoncostaeaceae bacterium]|jgi:hypothetical protein|nr:hypothetical protein [Miltoncostaeaceae bacterium]
MTARARTDRRRAAVLAAAGLMGLGAAALAGPASAATAPGTKTVTLNGTPQVSALADGHLWVLLFKSGSPALIEVDPSTARPTGRSVALPPDVRPQGDVDNSTSIPASLAVADGDLFVPAPDSLLQIDPERAKIVRRVPFPSRYVAAGDAGLWAIGDRPEPAVRLDGSTGYNWTLAQVDPTTGTIAKRIVLGPHFDEEVGLVQLAVGDTDLLVSTSSSPYSGRGLLQVDIATGTFGPGEGSGWFLAAHDGALYSIDESNGPLTVRHGDASQQVGVYELSDGNFWRDLEVGPDGAAWGLTFPVTGGHGYLVRQPLSGVGSRTPVPPDPVGVTVGTSTAWVINRSGHTLTRVPTAVLAQNDPVRLTADQLGINQRISQAAVRRLNALTARVDGLPPPEPVTGRRDRVRLTTEQLLINQRISQAAVRRANTLAGRLEGILPKKATRSSRGDAVTVSARQLLISQRIAQAAVRRANDLAERIPMFPFSWPEPQSFYLDKVIGTLETANLGVITITEPGWNGPFGDTVPFKVGDRMPVVFRNPQPSFGTGAPISAVGVVSGGVMYARYVSVEPPPGERS